MAGETSGSDRPNLDPTVDTCLLPEACTMQEEAVNKAAEAARAAVERLQGFSRLHRKAA